MRQRLLGLLAIPFALAFAAVPARAGYDLWTVEGGPFGGRVLELHTRTASGELFAGTEAGGIFRLEPSGWVPRNNELYVLDVLAIETSPTGPDTMFAGTGGGGVYRSANGGNSWFLSSIGLGSLTVRDLLYREGGGRLFAATAGGGICYTDDAGASWFSSNAGLTELSVRCLVRAPSQPTTWYAGTDNGVFRSLDDGATWAPRSGGLVDPVVNDLAVHPGNAGHVYAATAGGGVYRTLNGGSTWIARRSGMGEVYAEEILIREERPDTIYAATRSGFFETFDAGSTWTARKGGLADTVTTALLLRQDTLYVGTFWGGVYRTTSPAAGWTPRNAGLANRFVWELAVSPHDPGVVWAASYGGVSVSSDTGWTWRDSSQGVGAFDARTVAISPSAPSNLLAGFFYGGVYRSTNGGGSWTYSSSGLPTAARVTALRYEPGNGSRVLCGTYGGVYRSVNGGATWTSSSTGIGSKNVWGLATVPTAPLLVYAGTYENGLFRSRDFGATWDSVPLPDKFVRAIAVDPGDTSIVYAGGYYEEGLWGGVYKSTDGGATWSGRNSGLGNESVWCLALDPDDSEHILAATAGGVYESWNGAASWDPLLAGLEAPDIRWISIAGGRLLAGSFGGSIPWYEDGVVAVASGAPAGGALSLVAAPNPFNPRTTIRLDARHGDRPVEVRVFDIRGRLVRQLFGGVPPASGIEILWDGADDSGEPLPSGAYFAVASGGGERATRKLVLVR